MKEKEEEEFSVGFLSCCKFFFLSLSFPKKKGQICRERKKRRWDEREEEEEEFAVG